MVLEMVQLSPVKIPNVRIRNPDTNEVPKMAQENQPKVFLFHPDKLLQKKLEKIFFASEVEFQVFDNPPSLEILKKDPAVVFIDRKFLKAYLTIPKTICPGQCVLINSDEPGDMFEHMLKEPRLNHVIGRKEGEPIRSWEILYTTRRLAYEYKAYGLKNLLGWAGRIHDAWIMGTEDLHNIVQWVPSFCEAMGAPPKVREAFAELTHELLMNAVYDAVMDDEGNHPYAHDRKASVKLKESEYPLFSIGTDGEMLAVAVRDPFGGLRRKHVFGGLSRALQNQGQIDASGGGAGLGMMYIYQHGIGSIFTVKNEKMTEVIVYYDLSVNRRDFAVLPKSVHFYLE
ncbi:hypothetical protein KKF34_06835 [Myxococcota bacterium]|nr:hypothetical protein [Myxococcota bacterium]MBU1382417.1 hypothetical protein [Myxococcota bacterium]MBU1496576.1 hypothetical protein [Myxococcota bacterium]